MDIAIRINSTFESVIGNPNNATGEDHTNNLTLPAIDETISNQGTAEHGDFTVDPVTSSLGMGDTSHAITLKFIQINAARLKNNC